MVRVAKIAIISLIPVLFLLGISAPAVPKRPVSLPVSVLEVQQVQAQNPVVKVSLVKLASHHTETPVIETKDKVVVFVLDCFRGEESHGKNVLGIIQKNNFGKGEVKAVDLGDTIDKKDYLEALTRVLDYVRNRPEARVVVNLSFGSYSYDPSEHTLIGELSNKGVVIVAAAGNENTSSPCYPAAYDEAIAVAAVSSIHRKEKYSNYGPWIDIAAEGRLQTEIQSIESKDYGVYREQKITYLIKGGTSFAAPRVTGLIAYLLYQRADLSSQDIVELINNTAEPIEEYLYDQGELGAGRLNSYGVLRKADYFFESIIKAQTIGLFLFAIVWLVECIMGLFRGPRDFITPFMSGVLGGIVIWLIRVIAITTKGLFLGNLMGTAVLFLVGSLSVIIPPYLWWIAEREREKRYQELYTLMETRPNNEQHGKND